MKLLKHLMYSALDLLLLGTFYTLALMFAVAVFLGGFFFILELSTNSEAGMGFFFFALVAMFLSYIGAVSRRLL